MNFALNEEQRLCRRLFRDFSAKEVAPRAEDLDHEEKPPLDVLRQASQLGFLGATIPEEYFGAQLDFVSYALLIEALAAENGSLAVTLATHVSAVAMSVFEHGSDAQREEWLTPLAAGELIGAFACTEPEAGSDAMALQTRAISDGDQLVLDGVKTWVANGEIAGLFLVFARGGDDGQIEAFLVPREAPGLTVGYREPTLGLRSVTFNTLYLEGCRVPADHRLGGAGQGWAVARGAQDQMSIALAAMGLGLAESAVDEAAQFAAERVQFGVPIARKQAIQSYVAQAQVEVEALRYLVYHAAWLVGQDVGLSYEASVVKIFGARVARSVTDRMVQVMGGYGYMEDYPLARKYRDARALSLVGGPTELHEIEIAARVFADQGVEIAL